MEKEIKKKEKKEKTEKVKKIKFSAKQKKIILISSISVICIAIITTVILYLANEQVRDFLDQYLLGKNVSEENAQTIEIENQNSTHVIGYGRNICLLSNNSLKQYNSNARLEAEINVEINNPIYDFNDRYLAIGQKSGNKLYLINDLKIVWQKDVEGNISKISVNQNGYVSVIVTGTTHKTVIITFDSEGNELFKTYLSRTIAVDSCISNDNEYLAFAEISTSSTSTKSNIKTVSIEKARQDPANSIIYTYEVPDSTLSININYKDNGKLVCMFDKNIQIIENDTGREILNLEDDRNISFAGIDLSDSIFKATEESSGLFSANTRIEITNVNNEKKSIYTVTGVARTVETYKNAIALNLGTEIEFVDTNGWLIKRYNSTSEINDIVLANGIAGIVYKDKVEIINL